MRLSEVFLTSGRQLAPEYASMAWIGFSGKKPVAAQVCEFPSSSEESQKPL
jgi:hypothetical protein